MGSRIKDPSFWHALLVGRTIVSRLQPQRRNWRKIGVRTSLLGVTGRHLVRMISPQEKASECGLLSADSVGDSTEQAAERSSAPAVGLVRSHATKPYELIVRQSSFCTKERGRIQSDRLGGLQGQASAVAEKRRLNVTDVEATVQ